MTSNAIYQPLAKPTYLYIKQHSLTGMKYFGKTIKDPYKYNGSGKYWTKHIKKHGIEYITTLWVSDPFIDTSIVEFALNFSHVNNIIESKEWANLILENGLDGGETGNKGKPRSKSTKLKISKALTGISRSAEHSANISAAKMGVKISPNSDETKAKKSAAFKGIPKSELHKINLSGPKARTECPHCGFIGGVNNMKRYHFNNCKYYKSTQSLDISI